MTSNLFFIFKIVDFSMKICYYINNNKAKEEKYYDWIW